MESTTMPRSSPKPLLVALLALCATFLWGSAYPAVKLGYAAFQVPADQPFSQQLFGGVRFMIAGALILLERLALHPNVLLPRKGGWGRVIKLGLVCTVLQYVPYYIGLSHTAGVKCSIIGASSVFLSILIGCWAFRMEKLTLRKLGGCLLGFLGVVLINLDGGSFGGGFRADGELLILLSTLMSALATVQVKRYSAYDDTFMLYGWQFLLGGFVMAVIGLLGGGSIAPAAPSSWLLLLYLSFVSAGAYGLWGLLLRDHPVSQVVVWQFMTPIFGSVLSILFLGEHQALTWMVPLALVLVCCGIVFVNTTPPSAGQRLS